MVTWPLFQGLEMHHDAYMSFLQCGSSEELLFAKAQKTCRDRKTLVCVQQFFLDCLKN